MTDQDALHTLACKAHSFQLEDLVTRSRYCLDIIHQLSWGILNEGGGKPTNAHRPLRHFLVSPDEINMDRLAAYMGEAILYLRELHFAITGLGALVSLVLDPPEPDCEDPEKIRKILKDTILAERARLIQLLNDEEAGMKNVLDKYRAVFSPRVASRSDEFIEQGNQ